MPVEPLKKHCMLMLHVKQPVMMAGQVWKLLMERKVKFEIFNYTLLTENLAKIFILFQLEGDKFQQLIVLLKRKQEILEIDYMSSSRNIRRTS